jgi:Amt family ammonium transporter
MEQVTQLAYALDTFAFLLHGVLVLVAVAGTAWVTALLARGDERLDQGPGWMTAVALAALGYILFGYDIMYPGAGNGIIPETSLGVPFRSAASDHAAEAVLSSNGDIYFAGLSDIFFQAPFPLVGVAFLLGSLSGRGRGTSVTVLSALFTAILFPLFGYWKWGGGFLDESGFSDFAGATVVCTSAGWCALVGSIMIGPRPHAFRREAQKVREASQGVLLGAGALLILAGWLGFTGGSQLKLSDVAEANATAGIYVNTLVAGLGGVLGVRLAANLFRRSVPHLLRDSRPIGLLAGLVGISADPLTPTVIAAAVFGAGFGLAAVLLSMALDRLRIDDPVGAISAALAGGLLGTFLVPLTDANATFSAQMIGSAANATFFLVISVLYWSAVKLLSRRRSRGRPARSASKANQT